MLDIKQEGRVVTLTINRPERRNALNAELTALLSAELNKYSAAGDISAVILAGAALGFCAGSDLKELAGKTVDEMRAIELAKGQLVSQILTSAPPVIAAVEGFALGGGFALAACCDFVVTGADTRWHMPEAQNGWIPPWGIDAIKMRVGHFRARQFVLGQRVNGEQAVAAGLADKLAPTGQALQGAQQIAAELAALSPAVIGTIKKFFAGDGAIDAQIKRNDAQSADLFKDNCRYEPAISTLARFGVRND